MRSVEIVYQQFNGFLWKGSLAAATIANLSEFSDRKIAYYHLCKRRKENVLYKRREQEENWMLPATRRKLQSIKGKRKEKEERRL